MRRPLRRLRDDAHGSLSELNITPLLDLVFVLLVIFILTTPELANHLSLSLPAAEPTLAEAEPEPVRLIVDAQGVITLDGVTHTSSSLRSALGTWHRQNPRAGVVVRGSADVDYQRVIDVLDLLHELRIEKIGLDPEPGEVAP